MCALNDLSIFVNVEISDFYSKKFVKTQNFSESLANFSELEPSTTNFFAITLSDFNQKLIYVKWCYFTHPYDIFLKNSIFLE
jgi:hypothetical protein